MANKYEIISTPNEGKHYEISIWDEIESYSDYDKLFEELNKITKADRVTLYVSTPGGRCDVGFTLYDRICSVPAIVDVIVPYPTYSMGAILALVGDSLTINPGAFLMFHDYSTGARGKGNEIFKSTEAYKETFEYRFREVCQPFLSEKECTSILNGQDKYIKWNNKQLKTRMGRHFK